MENREPEAAYLPEVLDVPARMRIIKMKKTARIFLLLLLCLSVSGCRTRTGMNETAGSDFSEDQTGIRPGLFSGFLPDDRTGPEEQEKNGETGGQTKENPDASRKEYDETRPAEVM